MSDDKNDGVKAGSAAERLAQQRKELNLQTQPLEVIADLDWDVDDDDGFTLPNAVPEKKPEPAQEAKPVEQPAKKSSGTMMMSASEFSTALQDNGSIEKVTEKPAEATAAAVDAADTGATNVKGTMLISGAAVEKAVEEVKAQAAEEAKTAESKAVEEVTEAVKATQAAAERKAEPSTQSSGGTMLLSGAAMEEAMAAAKNIAKESDEDSKPTSSHKSVEGGAAERKAEPSTQSSGGTMLLSGAAMEQAMASAKQETAAAKEAIRKPLDSDTTGPVESASPAEQQPKAPNWEDEAPRQQAQWQDDSLSSTDDDTIPTKKGTNKMAVYAVIAIVAIIVILLLVKALG